MAEFMGLGIGFHALDKGLDKSLDKTTGKFMKTTDAIGDMEDAADGGGKRGGVFSSMIEGAKLLSLGRIGSQMEELSDGISGTEKSIDDVFKSLDTMQAKLSAAFNPQTAVKFQGAIDNIMVSSGVTADNAESLALGMVRFGRTSEEAMKALPMMGKLVGVLGIEADKVAQMYGSGLATLRATPGQLNKIAKQTVKMQKAYNLTDQVSSLPEIFDAVTNNAAKFGKVNAEASLRSVRDISRLSATFQKLGKSQEQATGIAIGFENSLADMRTAVLDMSVGLPANTDQINMLAEALSHAGVQNPFEQIQSNFGSVEDMSAFLRKSIEGLDDESRLRVTQRLRRVFGDDITNMLDGYSEDVDKINADVSKQEGQMGTAEEEFGKLEKTMMGTVEVQERLRDSAKDLLEINLQRVSKGKLLDVLNDERNAYLKLNDAVLDQNSALGQSMVLLHQLKSFGLRALFDSEAISMASIFLNVLSGFIFPLTAVLGLFQIFKGPLSVVTGLFSGLGKIMMSLISGPMSLFSKAWIGISTNVGMGMRSLVSGPMALFRKAWISISTEIGMRMFSVVDKLKSGLLGLGKIFSSLGSGIAKFAGIIGKFLLSPFKMVGKLVLFLSKGLLGLASTIMGAVLTAVKTFFAALLANPIGLIITGIVALGAAIVATIVYWDDIKAAMSTFFNWGMTKLSGFKDFFVEMWDGMFAGVSELFKSFQDWDSIKASMSEFFNWGMTKLSAFKDFFTSVWTGMFDWGMEKVTAYKDFFVSVWTGMFDGVTSLFKTFQEEGFSGLWDSLLESGKTAMDSLVNMVKGVWDKVVDAIPNVIKKVIGIETKEEGTKKSSFIPESVSGFFGFGSGSSEDTQQAGANINPSMQQQGAPANARTPLSVTPSARRSVDDENTQALVDEIADMKDTLVAALARLEDRGVNVQITGEMSKFLRAVKKENNRVAGNAGMGHALNG